MCTTSPLVFNIKIIVFIHILTDEQVLLSHYAKLNGVFLFTHNKTQIFELINAVELSDGVGDQTSV